MRVVLRPAILTRHCTDNLCQYAQYRQACIAPQYASTTKTILQLRHENITCFLMTQPVTRAYDFTPEELTRLTSTISAPRLGRYVRTCRDNTSAALRLYQWNLEISVAFFLPLQMLEVTVRNAVAEAIEAAYGPNWTHSRSFMLSLSAPRKAFNARQHLLSIAARHTVPSKVIADLNFIFWQKMLVRSLDSAFWNPHLRTVFPNAESDESIQQLRTRLHDGLETLRILRNRIAHHEPIFERDLHHDLRLIDSFIGYRCQHTVNWMRRIEQVSAHLAHCPLAAPLPLKLVQAKPA